MKLHASVWTNVALQISSTSIRGRLFIRQYTITLTKRNPKEMPPRTGARIYGFSMMSAFDECNVEDFFESDLIPSSSSEESSLSSAQGIRTEWSKSNYSMLHSCSELFSNQNETLIDVSMHEMRRAESSHIVLPDSLSWHCTWILIFWPAKASAFPGISTIRNLWLPWKPSFSTWESTFLDGCFIHILVAFSS